MKKALPGAGFSKELNAAIHDKFRDTFEYYYKDTSPEIYMTSAFNYMELADALLFEISYKVEFRTNETKDVE